MSEEHDTSDREWDRNEQAAHRAHDALDDRMVRVNEFAMNTANFALRTLVIINGGAGIAILTFIGTLISKIDGAYASKLVDIASPDISQRQVHRGLKSAKM